MLGFIQGKTDMNREDARIKLDQLLLHMNQSIVTPDELEYLEDLSEEMVFATMQMGINRKEARRLGKKEGY